MQNCSASFIEQQLATTNFFDGGGAVYFLDRPLISPPNTIITNVHFQLTDAAQAKADEAAARATEEFYARETERAHLRALGVAFLSDLDQQ